MPEFIIPKEPDFRDVKDRNRYMKDLYREVAQEELKKARTTGRNICRCGHTLSQHYMGTRAMPCSKCRCDYCVCENAERARRDMARAGMEDITPHPDFRKGR